MDDGVVEKEERLRREAGLVPGVYEAPVDIEHDNIDRRYKNDWTKCPIKAGTRLVLENRGDIYQTGYDIWTLSLENGRYGQELVDTRQAFWDVLAQLKPAEKQLSTIFHDSSWTRGPRAVLAVLVEQGRVSLDEVEQLAYAICDGKYWEECKKHGV